MIRIEMCHLSDVNDKLEYRFLYREMVKMGFIESFSIDKENSLKLPNGIYAIESSNVNAGGGVDSVFNSAKEAIRKALYPFYGVSWRSKYTLVVNGPGPIISDNLIKIKNPDSDSHYDKTEEDDS